jgi:hypothetical protein
MSVNSKAKYFHYLVLSLLAIVSIEGGLYCGSLSFTLLGLVCTGLEFAFVSGPKNYRYVQQGFNPLAHRLPVMLCGVVLGIPGFLYVLADMVNCEPGSPRYPVSLVVCSGFAVGFTAWLLLAMSSVLPRRPANSSSVAGSKLAIDETEQRDKQSSGGLAAAGVVLLMTLTFLSGALRASAVFEPTRLVVKGIFPWQDRSYPYASLTTVQPVSFYYGPGPEHKAETVFRLQFADAGAFDLGPTWIWRCPRDKQGVDNRIMALLQPHLAKLSDRLMAADANPKTIPTLSEPADPREYGINPALPIPQQIATLETYLQTHAGPYDSYGHNILRHLYMAVNERKAMEECDHIFANSFMDDYTLQCLSDWTLDREPAKALKYLQRVSNKYEDLKYLHAACTLEIARLYKQLHQAPDASRYLAMLIKDNDSEISDYRAAAVNPED